MEFDMINLICMLVLRYDDNCEWVDWKWRNIIESGDLLFFFGMMFIWNVFGIGNFGRW